MKKPIVHNSINLIFLIDIRKKFIYLYMITFFTFLLFIKKIHIRPSLNIKILDYKKKIMQNEIHQPR